ncbi:hypothetical protein [Baekduia sp. Peel2402]|uniref:hypothetical protein n=1 Tax=Baekduia sp. Peel2402 TaxID=3458296 RepID=UPI00403E3B25
MRKFMLLATTLAAAVVPGTAMAETYTLDGQPAERAAAIAASAGDGKGGCAANASPDGVIACFSTPRLAQAAVADALKAATLPPGFAVMPDEKSKAQLLQSLAPAATAQSAGRPKAHKADNCNATPTFVWTDANRNGIQGWFYATGYGNWVNHSSDFNNSISSYWNGVNGTARWHDLANGGGDYYGLSYQCREVWDLSNGGWNDRFTSYAAW